MRVPLYALLATMAAMLIFWGVIWFQTSNIVQTRLSDMMVIVSEENCLPSEGGIYSSRSTFNELLKRSETSWLVFNTTASSYENGLSYFVGDESTGQTYFNYIDAPQRGSAIDLKIRGYMYLPLLVSVGLDRFAVTEDYTYTGETLVENANGIALVRRILPNGKPRVLEIRVPIEKEYVAMGLRFFKDKL